MGGNLGRRAEPEVRDEIRRLKDVCRELGIRDRVVFTGAVQQEKLHYYYSAANACVIPSYYEPFGMVPLEAMACKVPVIASDTGGLPYTVRDGKSGILVPVRNPGAIANQIYNVLTNRELNDKLVRGGRELVKTTFSWNIIAKQVAHAYERTIEKSGGRSKRSLPSLDRLKGLPLATFACRKKTEYAGYPTLIRPSTSLGLRRAGQEDGINPITINIYTPMATLTQEYFDKGLERFATAIQKTLLAFGRS